MQRMPDRPFAVGLRVLSLLLLLLLRVSATECARSRCNHGGGRGIRMGGRSGWGIRLRELCPVE